MLVSVAAPTVGALARNASRTNSLHSLDYVHAVEGNRMPVALANYDG